MKREEFLVWIRAQIDEEKVVLQSSQNIVMTKLSFMSADDLFRDSADMLKMQMRITTLEEVLSKLGV